MPLRWMIPALVLILVSSAAAQSNVLFSETFTGPYQSSPAGWVTVNTPEGSYWYLRDGQYTSGNGDTIRAQDKRSYAVVEAGETWADYEVVADAHMIQRNGGIMLVGRWNGARDHYEAVYETQEGRVSCRIVRVLDGRTETLAEITSDRDPSLPNLANGATQADGRRFRLAFNGDRITFSLGQREILSAADDSLVQGTAGVGQFENFVFFDNFRVVSGQAAVAAPSPGAPTPSQPSEDIDRVYRLRVAWDFTRQEARDYQRSLENMDFVPVILRESSPGRYDVLTGTFLSRGEAQRQGEFLLAEGDLIDFTVEEIVGSAAAQEELAAAAAPVSAYSIEVARASGRREAEETRDFLAEDLGFFPVTILDQQGEFVILVGNFSEEDEAARLLEDLDSEGFPFAHVVQAGRRELTQSITVADAGLGQEVLNSLSPSERRRVERVLSQQQELAAGGNTVEQIRELQDLLVELRRDYSGLADSVESIQERAEQRDRQQREIADLIQMAEAAIDSHQWEEAREHIDHILELDNSNAVARSLSAHVRAARSSTGSGTAEQDIGRIIANANRRAELGDYVGAIASLAEAQEQFPNVTALSTRRLELEAERSRVEASLEQQRIEDARRAAAQSSGFGFDNRFMVIIVVALILLLVIVLTFMIRLWFRVQTYPMAPAVVAPQAQYTTENEEFMPDPLMRHAETDTLEEEVTDPGFGSVATGSGGIGLDPAEANQDVSVLSSMVLATVGAAGVSSRASVSRTESAPKQRVTLDLGFDDNPPAASVGSTGITEMPEETTGGGLLDLGFDEMEPPKTGEVPDDLLGVTESVSSALDDVFMSSEDESPLAPLDEINLDMGPSTPALDETQPMPSLSDPFAMDEGLSEVPPARVSASAPVGVDTGGDLFSQRFTADQEGQQPENWSGKYDFASLAVITEGTLPGSEACLRFEKKSAAGSAFYSCRFPDAKGRVGIEFDLKCDHKNQYLLGLYFEHDGNFRQSVHTVVHRSDETVTLRLQGKTHPYEFGQWVHVKFRIDLSTGMVDGQVNGTPVAVNVPLLSMADQRLPPAINTISIRDTLASEGAFSLDNLRVYRA